MRTLAVISFLLLGIVLRGQDPIAIRGSVFSSDSDSPIQGAHIRIIHGDVNTITDSKGRFTIQVTHVRAAQVRLEIRHVSYERQEVEVSLTQPSVSDPIRVYLMPIAHPLPTVEIRSDELPEVIYGSPRHSIADYEFIGDSILLLTYEKRVQRSAKLYLVDSDMEPVDSVTLPSRLKAIGLERDYADEVYIRGEERIYQVVMDSYGLRASRIEKDLYEDQIVPVLAKVDDTYVFHTRSEQLPFFDYYAFDTRSDSYQELQHIADEGMLRMCRAEYKYLSTRDKLNMFRMELETGVEKELLTCMASFDGVPYYRTPYAPGFIQGEELIIFDHPSELIRRVDLMGTRKDSVPIGYRQYHKVMNNPFERVIQDPMAGEFYALMQYPGGRASLDRIDPVTGSTSRVFTFTYDYPEAVQVRGGEVFYTYRPFGSMQKRYLYQEDIEHDRPLLAH